MGRGLVAALLVSVAPAFCAGGADAFPGPPLRAKPGVLEAALHCSDESRTLRSRTVLLVHGTWTNPDESWSWGYVPALSSAGYPTCTVTLPESGLVDVQRSVEYLVDAIRTISESSGHKLAIVGHSQGGLLSQWALRFWPDLKRRISDVIALSGVHRGWSVQENCSTECPLRFPAAWQMTPGSRILRTLQRAPLPRGPAYTSIASQADLIVAPREAVLEGARNVVIQDLCPARPIDHITVLGDAVSFDLVVDALEHAGPANPMRIDATACLEVALPAFDPAGAAAVAPSFASSLARSSVVVIEAEPQLRCYARPSCAR